MKELGFGARIQRRLREQFPEAHEADDFPAAVVLRGCMHAYVARPVSGAPKAQGMIAAIQRDVGISKAL
jgi:hypothetical protein